MVREERNILRRMFLDPEARATDLVEELRARSNELARMWEENNVQTTGEGAKTIRKPTVGEITFEYSSFAVDGRPDLKMMIYNPATDSDIAKMQALCG